MNTNLNKNISADVTTVTSNDENSRSLSANDVSRANRRSVRRKSRGATHRSASIEDRDGDKRDHSENNRDHSSRKSYNRRRQRAQTADGGAGSNARVVRVSSVPRRGSGVAKRSSWDTVPVTLVPRGSILHFEAPSIATVMRPSQQQAPVGHIHSDLSDSAAFSNNVFFACPFF